MNVLVSVCATRDGESERRAPRIGIARGKADAKFGCAELSWLAAKHACDQ